MTMEASLSLTKQIAFRWDGNLAETFRSDMESWMKTFTCVKLTTNAYISVNILTCFSLLLALIPEAVI